MNQPDNVVPGQRATPDRAEIVVATDGSSAAAVAVQYALGLAAESGAPVRIVHVVPSHLPVPPGLGDAVKQAGADLLLDVSRRAQLAAPQVDVRATLLGGPRGVQLVAAAQSAELVVLGRSARKSHLVTGSTAAALVEHTDRPVRVVPPDWFKRGSRSEVVVGIKEPTKSQALIERGFQLAAGLGQPLVLLHVWGLPSGYEEIMALADSDAWNAQLAENLDAVVRPVRRRYPDVPYQIRVVHGRPAHALESASRRAAFLLLGRTAHRHPFGPRTDIAHVLMNVGGCPVEVGPELETPAPSMDLQLEADGRLLR